MSIVTPIGGNQSLDQFRTTIKDRDMWELTELRPYITTVSRQSYQDCVLSVLDHLGDEDDHSHIEARGGDELYFFDREVFQLVCDALDAPQEIQEYFAPPKPSIRERLARVSQPEDDRSPFDRLRQVREDGTEFWSARDLQPMLGYDRWHGFQRAIDRAIKAAQNMGHDVDSTFVQVSRVTHVGNLGEQESLDYELSRFAAYLIAMNGDPRKAEVAAAQAYFAVKTREAEVQQATPQFQLPTNMAEALRLAADEHERAELEKAERLALEAKREEEAPWVAKAKGLTSGDKYLTKQEFARRVQQMGMKDGLDIKQRDVYELLSQKGMTIKNSYRQFGKVVRRSDHGTATAHAIKSGWADNEHEVTPGGKEIVKTKMSPRGINLAWKWVAKAIEEHGEDLVAKEDVA